jgi:hypothetical protein
LGVGLQSLSASQHSSVFDLTNGTKSAVEKFRWISHIENAAAALSLAPSCHAFSRILSAPPTENKPRPFRILVVDCSASAHPVHFSTTLQLSLCPADAILVRPKLAFAAIAAFLLIVYGQPAQAQIVPSLPSMPSPSTPDLEDLPNKPSPAAKDSGPPTAPVIRTSPHSADPVTDVVRRPFRAWLALSLVGQAAVLADAKTTLDLKHSYPLTFREPDPLAGPLVNLPASACIVSTVTLTAALSAASWKLTRSQHDSLQRRWWLPQAAQVILNSECAFRNSRR